MVNIWLDDVRPAPDGWIWAKTAIECLTHLTHNIGNVNILSLDHDLGEDLTGYDVCKQICDGTTLFFPNRIYLHTMNGVGRENMYKLLARYIEVFELDTKLFYGPLWIAWEQSIEKCKERGYF